MASETSQNSNDFNSQAPGFDYMGATENAPTKIEDVKTGTTTRPDKHDAIHSQFGRMLKQHAMIQGAAEEWSEPMKKFARDGWKQMHNVQAIHWWVYLLKLLPWRQSGAGHTKSFMIDTLVEARQRPITPLALIEACRVFVASQKDPKEDWIFPIRTPPIYIIETGVDDPVIGEVNTEDDDDDDLSDEMKRDSKPARRVKTSTSDAMADFLSTVTALISKTAGTAVPEVPEISIVHVKAQTSKLKATLSKCVAEGTHCEFYCFSVDFSLKQASMLRSSEKQMVMGSDGKLSFRAENAPRKIESWSTFCQAYMNFIRIMFMTDNKAQLIPDRIDFFLWLSNTAFPHERKINYFYEFFWLYCGAIDWMARKSADAALLAEFLSSPPPRRALNAPTHFDRAGNRRGGGEDSHRRKKRERARKEKESRERRSRYRDDRSAERSPPRSPGGRGKPSKRKKPSSSSYSSSSSSSKPICFSCSDVAFICIGSKCSYRHECIKCKGNHSLVDHP
jgi:hypothetical protein